MSIRTGVRVKGDVDIDVRNRRGQLVEQRAISNMIVDNGIELLSRLLVSSFLNSTSDNFYTAPLQAIAVGTGTDTDEMSRRTGLEDEWAREVLEQVQISSATASLLDTGSNVVLQVNSKLAGAYGNRILVNIDETSTPYEITVDDKNNPFWDGTQFQPGTATERSYSGDSLESLASALTADRVISASATNVAGTGTLVTLSEGVYLSNGGDSVVVSATFTTEDSSSTALTEAGLFTADSMSNSNDIMFNMVRFRSNQYQ